MANTRFINQNIFPKQPQKEARKNQFAFGAGRLIRFARHHEYKLSGQILCENNMTRHLNKNIV